MNSVADIMNYFSYFMVLIYVLGGIILVSTAASIKKQQCKGVFIFISTVVMIGFFSVFIFFGVLADNNAPNLGFWSKQLVGITLVSGVCWLIQIVSLFKKINKR